MGCSTVGMQDTVALQAVVCRSRGSAIDWAWASRQHVISDDATHLVSEDETMGRCPATSARGVPVSAMICHAPAASAAAIITLAGGKDDARVRAVHVADLLCCAFSERVVAR